MPEPTEPFLTPGEMRWRFAWAIGMTISMVAFLAGLIV